MHWCRSPTPPSQSMVSPSQYQSTNPPYLSSSQFYFCRQMERSLGALKKALLLKICREALSTIVLLLSLPCLKDSVLQVCFYLYFIVELKSNAGHDRHSVEFSRSRTLRHTHTQRTSFERVIVPTQHTIYTGNVYPCPQRDLNPRSRKSSSRRPTPQTPRPPGSA